MELAREAKTEGADDVIVGLPIAAVGGLILFSFCLLKHNYMLLEEELIQNSSSIVVIKKGRNIKIHPCIYPTILTILISTYYKTTHELLLSPLQGYLLVKLSPRTWALGFG